MLTREGGCGNILTALSKQCIPDHARVVELVDSLASGASARKGVRVRLPPRAPRKRTSNRMSFFGGKSLQSRYFKFWTEHLKSCPTALLGRGAFATFEGFAVGKTLDAGEIHFRRALKYRGVEPPSGRRNPQKRCISQGDCLIADKTEL